MTQTDTSRVKHAQTATQTITRKIKGNEKRATARRGNRTPIGGSKKGSTEVKESPTKPPGELPMVKIWFHTQ